MSIEAVANVVSTHISDRAVSNRPEPIPDNTGQVRILPQADDPPKATVTTLSEAARALQATDEQAARDAPVEASVSALSNVIYRDWAPGAPTGDDGAVQEALDALTEASRESLNLAVAAALTVLHDQAALEQKAVDEAKTLADQQRDAAVLSALNAEIRLAYGALPSPVAGDPVLRDPGQVDVIA
jgi:hypothetical protein